MMGKGGGGLVREDRKGRCTSSCRRVSSMRDCASAYVSAARLLITLFVNLHKHDAVHLTILSGARLRAHICTVM